MTTVGYFATWVGVVLYTAIFISEVVRSGIMAVSKGQSEAGLSLGLRKPSRAVPRAAFLSGLFGSGNLLPSPQRQLLHYRVDLYPA